MKIVLLLGFAAILGSLAVSLVFIVRNQGQRRQTAWALTCRVGLSMLLFALLWIAHAFNWIRPHGIVP